MSELKEIAKVVHNGVLDLCKIAIELEDDNKRLNDLIQKMADHNLKQGILLDAHGLDCEEVSVNSMNGLKAAAIREMIDDHTSTVVADDGDSYIWCKVAASYADRLESGEIE